MRFVGIIITVVSVLWWLVSFIPILRLVSIPDSNNPFYVCAITISSLLLFALGYSINCLKQKDIRFKLFNNGIIQIILIVSPFLINAAYFAYVMINAINDPHWDGTDSVALSFNVTFLPFFVGMCIKLVKIRLTLRLLISCFALTIPFIAWLITTVVIIIIGLRCGFFL